MEHVKKIRLRLEQGQGFDKLNIAGVNGGMGLEILV